MDYDPTIERHLELSVNPLPLGFVSRQSIVMAVVLFACAAPECGAAGPTISNVVEKTALEGRAAVLLLDGKFDVLDDGLQALQAKYAADPTTENDVHKVAYEFYRADRRLEAPLDAWVVQHPRSAMARLARGIYRTKMGWATRGARWAFQTSDRQMAGMGEWMKGAKEDLVRALELDPSLVEAACYLIEEEMATGGAEKRKFFDQALKANPASFIAREFYLHSLLPRWGGSYDAMDAVMSEARPYYARMPRLAVLEGRASADRGDLALDRKDYAEARKELDAALAKGDFWFYNYTKGLLLYRTRDYAGAIDPFTRAIAEKPGYKGSWWMRAQAFKNLGRLPEALADIERAVAIEPRDDEVIAARGYILERMGELPRALEDFRAASMIDPAYEPYKRVIQRILAAMASNPSAKPH